VFFIQTGLNFIPKNNGYRPPMPDDDVNDVIIDADYVHEDAVNGPGFPANILDNLRTVQVQYYSFDRKLHQGQLVIHKDLVDDVKSIFNIIKEKKFPVAKVIPIVKYEWDDLKSMSDNNTSAFNYRMIAGTNKLSNHSFGFAIDINPLLNPFVRKNDISPEGAVYDPDAEGTITYDSFIVKEFKKRGWTWGGDWKDRKDYQHFEKIVRKI
jgi:hypothetical protein